VPLFEQVAVLREVDLHYKWSPFVTSSMTIQDIDKLDTVGWAVVGLPQFGLARDGCFRAFGCDCIMEDGSFLLVGQGVQDRPEDVPYDEPFFLEGLEGLQIPDPPTRLGSGRVTVRGFSGVVHILSPTKVRTRIVSNINPNLPFIPKSLLDFVMKRMCGVLFSRLQYAAKKAAADPVRNPHAQRMRENEAFYKGWLMPKFQSYCDHVGWTMPTVPAFNLTEEQLQRAGRLHEAHSIPVPPIRSLTSLESPESAPSMNGNGVHPSSASAPDLEPQNVQGETSAAGLQVQFSDSNSAISSVSGDVSMKSFLHDNPISQYLRELEERTQREKARKIAEGRQQVAEQLRPRSISDDNYARLQQLKEAKARRQRRKGPSPVQQPNGPIDAETTEGGTLTLTDRFHSHGRATRFVVTFVLVMALLLTLCSDRLLGFDSILRMHAESIWTDILLDIATLAYIGVSTAVFFVMSYVSLVYAFDSLDIGTKSGKRSKEFYGQTISSIVAGISMAIILLSVGKAIVAVWFRVGLWYSLQAIRWAKSESQNALRDQHNLAWFLDHVPKPIQSVAATALSHVSPLVRGFVGTGQSIVWFVQHWFVVIVIRSNFVGRAIAALTLKAAGFFAYMVAMWERYVSHVVGLYTDEDVTLASWRGVAVDTARPLLVYTAVFLLSMLVFFNATARAKTKKRESKKEGDTSSVSVKSDYFPLESAMAAAPTGAAPAQTLRNQDVSSVSMQDDIIPEEDEDSVLSMTDTCATDYVVGCTETARKKRFRLRRRKKHGAQTDDTSVQSSVTGAFIKMKGTKMKKMDTC